MVPVGIGDVRARNGHVQSTAAEVWLTDSDPQLFSTTTVPQSMVCAAAVVVDNHRQHVVLERIAVTAAG